MEIDGASPSIEVLLATHNGEKFLRDQLESLLAQDHADFTILVNDDGSSDATLDILHEFAERHPGLMRILPATQTKLGASGNFAKLVEAASADYIFFCDQDDVWQPEKISATMALMAQMEERYSRNEPILVHTDLAVVGADLAELHPSFMTYAGIRPLRSSFSALLLGNVVTGCTILANRALYQMARPIPPEALMFDHWLAQVAAGIGHIAYLDRATVRYRQHANNAIGARRAGLASFSQRAERTLLSVDVLSVLSQYTQHAAVLHARYFDQLAPGDAKKARLLADIWTMPRLRRAIAIAQSGLFKATTSSNLGLVVLLLRDGSPQRFDRKP